MPASTQITEPALISVLETASQIREQCAQIIALLHDLSPSSTQATPLDPSTLWTAQRTLTAQIAQLRGQNRKAVQSVRSTKAQTSEARHEVDDLHLHLQNLYYEQRHLRGEIAACDEYEHKYLRLPMIPSEDFLARHPEHASSCPHELTIARIEDEHAARLALEGERVRLVRRKEALAREAGQRKEELARLDNEIEKWVGAQAGVRRIFEARERKMKETEKARDREKAKEKGRGRGKGGRGEANGDDEEGEEEGAEGDGGQEEAS